MDILPKDIICKAYLVNNLPEKITGDLANMLSMDKELLDIAFRKDYASLISGIIKTIAMKDLPDMIGPKTFEACKAANCTYLGFWMLAAKCGFTFQAEIAVAENDGIAVPHMHVPNASVRLTENGYIMVSSDKLDKWSLIVNVNTQKLIKVIANAATFPLRYYNKQLEKKIAYLRVKNKKLTNLDVIFSLLGQEGIAQYVSIHGITNPDDETLKMLATPSVTVTICDIEVPTAYFDKSKLSKAIEATCKLNSQDKRICALNDICKILIPLQHVIDNSIGIAVMKKAKEAIDEMMKKPELFTLERYKTFNTAIAAFTE